MSVRLPSIPIDVNVRLDPYLYRNPEDGSRFLVATISTTRRLGDANALDVLTTEDREAYSLDGLEERTSTIANALRSRPDGTRDHGGRS